jgi:nucleoside-diphosphate-sugar epimerase
VKVLVAGATGAIGKHLIAALRVAGHSIFAMVRSSDPRTLAGAGVEAVVADALDEAAVKDAILRVGPDAIINELTSLPKRYTPEAMKAAAGRDANVRLTGNVNLLSAAAAAGVRRYILQSSGFWYAPGPGLAAESEPFAFDAAPGIAASARTYAELEARLFEAAGIEQVVLRYGFFYGPGSWFTADADMGEQVRAGQVPIIGEGRGTWSFVHLEDAARATAAALESAPGIYNIVDSNPSEQRIWLPAFARAVGAGQPPRITEEQALASAGPDAVYYAERLRGASNAKARAELGFRPRPLEWLANTTAG